MGSFKLQNQAELLPCFLIYLISFSAVAACSAYSVICELLECIFSTFC